MTRPRKVAIIVGSTSDFTQCTEAVTILANAEQTGKIKVITPAPNDKFIVASIHRHKDYLLNTVLPLLIERGVTAIICGAGWAAHLPGMVDSHLRYDLGNDTISVIGVAFDDANYNRHTDAAILSISEVPGTQVIFDEKTHVGANGMIHAVDIAINSKLPPITLPDLSKKPHGTFTFSNVLHIAKLKN